MRCARLFNAKLIVAAMLGLTTMTATGCIGLTAQLLYIFKGEKVKAEYAGLKDQRVAVVCVSPTASFGPGAESAMLAQTVGTILRQKVKNVEVVRDSEVADWIDRNDWNQIDFRNVGRGVNADMVLALELDSFSVNEGSTLYKGRATVSATVFDMSKGGEVVFRPGPVDIVYPTNGARHSTETTEAKFRREFIFFVAHQLSKRFYDYDLIDDVAVDTTFVR